MLDTFGSLARLLRADPGLVDALVPSLYGYGSLLAAVAAIFGEVERSRFGGTRVATADPIFRRYLAGKFASLRCEGLLAVYLDSRGIFIADDLTGQGSRSEVPLKCRTLLGRAFALDAAGLILVHNHPSGDCSPSAADLAVTQEFKAITDLFEVELVDHLVVAGENVYSIRQGRRL